MGTELNEVSYWSEDFTNLQLLGQTVANKEFEACRFIDCNFSDGVFRDCKFVDCEFIHCNLSLLTPDYSEFNNVTFKQSKLNGIDWTKISLSNLMASNPFQFQQCLLNDNSFFAMQLNKLIATDCKIHRVDFRDGDFTEANFSDSEFDGSLFNNTNLTEADFTDALEYDIDINFNRVNKAKFSRVEAMRLLAHLGITLVD